VKSETHNNNLQTVMMDRDASSSSLLLFATGADWVLPLLTTGAMVCVAAIPVLQSDSVSRQLLSPPKLQAKRKATYRYRWEKFTTKELLKTLQTMGGDDNLVLLVQEEELREFIVDRCMKGQGNPKILCVGVDEQLPTREVCVWIWMQDDGIMYQASMKKFGLLLADIMEDTMSTTALCFVADASGGLGTKLVTNVLTECVASLDVVSQTPKLSTVPVTGHLSSHIYSLQFTYVHTYTYTHIHAHK
jgi:hypothetical protein